MRDSPTPTGRYAASEQADDEEAHAASRRRGAAGRRSSGQRTRQTPRGRRRRPPQDARCDAYRPLSGRLPCTRAHSTIGGHVHRRPTACAAPRRADAPASLPAASSPSRRSPNRSPNAPPDRGGFLQRLFPPAPKLPNRPDPLAGFTRRRTAAPHHGARLSCCASNLLAWLLPGLVAFVGFLASFSYGSGRPRPARARSCCSAASSRRAGSAGNGRRCSAWRQRCSASSSPRPSCSSRSPRRARRPTRSGSRPR